MAKKQKQEYHVPDLVLNPEKLGEIYNLELLHLFLDPNKDVKIKTDDGRLVIQVRDKK